MNTKYNCNFDINLHRTYNDLGLVDKDEHEFLLQSGNINYKSTDGIGEYLLNVENKNSSKSLLNLFGKAADLSEMSHKMNAFDASRVEIYNVTGKITYN